MAKKSRPRKDFPYYKVQVFSDRQFCWVDARKEAFGELEDAKTFIARVIDSNKVRIQVVEEKKRYILEE
ncbi:MAG: hypothetical protein AAGA30_01445 [Planctomycetota bacterium]